jgi:hypothetical protein
LQFIDKHLVTPAKAGVQDIMVFEIINMLLLPGRNKNSRARSSA